MHALAQLLLASAQLALPLQQAGAPDALGQRRQLITELRRDAGELRTVRGSGHQHQIPQDPRQALEHGSRITSAIQQLACGLQERHRFAGAHGLHQFQQLLFRNGSQQIPDGIGFDGAGQQAELIQQAFGIAQTALSPLGHHMQCFRLDGNRFLFGNPAQVLFKRIQGNPPEVESLAAAEDGGKHPLGIGGRQHEHHLRRGFLQGLEQRIERCGGEHVAFIHHIHLPARLHRREPGAFDQVADVVDAGVGGRVDFDHVQGGARRDRGAELAGAAGFRGGSFTAQAIERAGQDARAGGLAGAARTTEQISGRNAAGAQGMTEGGGDRFLPHQLIQALGPVFVMQWLVRLTHALLARR